MRRLVLIALAVSWPCVGSSTQLLDPILPSSEELRNGVKAVATQDGARVSLSAPGLAHTAFAFEQQPQPENARLVGSLALNATQITTLQSGLFSESAVLEVDSRPPVATLVIEGRTYELRSASQVLDEKSAMRHVTMQVLNLPDSYARFSVGWDGLIVGTLQTPSCTYRIMPVDADTQQVFCLAAAASDRPARQRRIAAASSDGRVQGIEKRHVQLEEIADRRPEFSLTSEQGRSFVIRGGELGRVSRASVQPQDIVRALGALSHLSLAPATLEVRITREAPVGSDRRIEFEQLVSGIPVWQRNLLIVGRDRTIREIRTRLVDPERAVSAALLSENAALERAMAALQARFGSEAGEFELLAPTQLHYYIELGEFELSPKYRFAVDAGQHGSWRVMVHAQSGLVDMIDARQYAGAFGYRVCRDISATEHPRTCSDPGADLVWANLLNGLSFCPYRNPMGGSLCTQTDPFQAQGALLNADRILSTYVPSGASYCCALLGGSDRELHLVYRSSGSILDSAHYDPQTESIVSPQSSTELRSWETIWHEFGHHYFYKYNPQMSNLYGSNHSFVNSFIESFGDLMDAALVLAGNEGSGDTSTAWIHGDGMFHAGPDRVLNDLSLSFAHLGQLHLSPHERGRAISAFFYRIKVNSGISGPRFLQFLLEVGDRFDDFDGNGPDVIDLKNAMHMSIRPDEPALLNSMNSTFDTMYDVAPGSGPPPPAAQLPSGVPSPPFPVTAVFLRCSQTQSGAAASDWWVEWPFVSNAAFYIGYIKGEFAPFISDATSTTNNNLIARVFGLGGRAYVMVQSCNSAGCGHLSNQPMIEMVSFCHH